MRTRIVFVSLTIMVSTFPFQILGGKGPDSSLSLRQRVDIETSNLTQNLKSMSNSSERQKEIQSSIRFVDETRLKMGRQKEPDEIYLDQIREILEQLKVFANSKSAESCRGTEAQLKAQFQPQDVPERSNPALQKGLEILRQICQFERSKPHKKGP